MLLAFSLREDEKGRCDIAAIMDSDLAVCNHQFNMAPRLKSMVSNFRMSFLPFLWSFIELYIK